MSTTPPQSKGPRGQQMRAVYYERQGAAEDVLVFGELPKPAPAAGEVLVRIYFSGINPSDIKHRTGFVSKMAFARMLG